ncbi:hypothetical protein FJV83_23515 [Mesorhizobium sp. WSM4307]|nr:hypothetical protein FJV81_36025 [Mesorhizobium sp. WSM4315]TRC82579.1 hypothetical protein FJV83_23515 [Mesorhizobium sp. WSM4307]
MPTVRLRDVTFAAGAASHRFVILGRSKERSDAAQTPGAAPQPKGSMPGLRSVATVQVLLRRILRPRSRHGSSGLRDGASLPLRPWMTKVGKRRPIASVSAGSLNRTARTADAGPLA